VSRLSPEGEQEFRVRGERMRQIFAVREATSWSWPSIGRWLAMVGPELIKLGREVETMQAGQSGNGNPQSIEG